MTSTFHTLRLGTCNVYLIRGTSGFVLIDAGNRRKAPLFKKRLKTLKIHPHEIQTLIITHVHFDHVGSCRAIKSLTGAKVMVHQAERHLLEEGTVVIPPGTSPPHRLLGKLGDRYFRNLFRFPAANVETEITGKTSLKPYGIDGFILPTPGHTKGSISVVLNEGKAFVGDLATNFLPLGIGNYLPPYGEDIPRILSSWETLLKTGVKVFYPAHGFPIRAPRLLAALMKNRKRTHG